MSTKKQPQPPTELGIYADQLRDAITLVKPFIGHDDTLPMLRGYRFEVRRGDLYVIGTDRYTLAVARVAARDEQKFPAGFAAFIPATLASRALALFKPPRSKFPPSPLKVSTGGTWSAIENVPQDEPPTRLVGQIVSDPKGMGLTRVCRQVIQDWRDALNVEASSALAIGMNPAYTARVAAVQKVLGSGAAVTMRVHTHNKPITFIAENFFAMQMPIRMPDSETAELDAWAERFADPEPAAKPARKAAAKKAAPKKKTPARKAKVA